MQARRALVVEGGGMKAAYANGVLSAFEEAGHHAFDAVYGTSAGGALAAWYTARQAVFAEATWQYASDARILSYGRYLTRRGHLLDHDALLEIVYLKEHPIDQDAIRRSPWPVVVTASDIEAGAPVYQDLRKADIIQWLKATGRLPFACGPPVEIGGRRYLDGGILDPIPVRKAIADGCTDITVVANNEPGHKKTDNKLVARIAGRPYPRLRDAIGRHHEIKQAAMDFCRAPGDGITLRMVRPQSKTGLHRLSRDQAVIRAGIQRGRADGNAFLAGRRLQDEVTVATPGEAAAAAEA